MIQSVTTKISVSDPVPRVVVLVLRPGDDKLGVGVACSSSCSLPLSPASSINCLDLSADLYRELQQV